MRWIFISASQALLFLFFSRESFSQNEQKYWIFGNSGPAHIQFSFSGPASNWAAPFSTNPPPPPNSVILGFEGTGILTNPQTGQLIESFEKLPSL